MKVLFVDTVHEILQKRLESLNVVCIDASDLAYQDCVKAAENVDGIVIRSRFRMDEAFLNHTKQLKFIARSGAGMENIDTNYCKKHNIHLFNAPEANCVAVGEHALGMLLSLFNKLLKGDAEIRNHRWNRESNRGVELTGKTVGIIGYGHNGSAFAKLLKGFQCKVLAYDKYKSNFSDDYVIESSLENLYEQAEVISFHIPQNEETLFWANDSFFNSIKQDFYLLNLSRGKIVQSSALVKALKSDKVKGVALDVLEYESSSFEDIFANVSPDFDYLLNSNKVIFSPHVGGWTVESYFKLSNVLADKIEQTFFT